MRFNIKFAGTGISAAKTGKDAARTGKDAAQKISFCIFFEEKNEARQWIVGTS